VSASAEDEARARLEVAQLYEEMGQADKAVKYLLGAGEILRSGGLMTRAREIYQRILRLDPANPSALQALNSILGAGGAAPGDPPAAGQAAQVAPPRTSSSSGEGALPAAVHAQAEVSAEITNSGLQVPTPLLYRDARLIAAVRSEVNQGPDHGLFPYDPLPKVDPAVLAARAEARKKAEDVARKKATPRVESAFGGPGGGYASPVNRPTSGGLSGAQTSGGSKFGAQRAPEPQTSRFTGGSGEIRGGNRDLAEQIARRLKGGDQKK
jgi:hypothetical protein